MEPDSLAVWRRHFDFTAAETFFNEFDYPGLLADIISGSRPRAPETLAQMDRRRPEVNLLTQQQRGEISERNLNVTISVTEKPAGNSYATERGVRDVRLFRNGSLVKVWRGDVLKGQSSTTLEVNIPVVAGENRLTAYAFNRDNVKSQNATLNVKGTESLRRAGVAYVVAIGINVYENPQYNLRYAVADAQSFADEVRLCDNRSSHVISGSRSFRSRIMGDQREHPYSVQAAHRIDGRITTQCTRCTATAQTCTTRGHCSYLLRGPWYCTRSTLLSDSTRPGICRRHN